MAYEFDWDWLHIMCRGIDVVKDHSHTFAVVMPHKIHESKGNKIHESKWNIVNLRFDNVNLREMTFIESLDS